jgi:hypothetical protein
MSGALAATRLTGIRVSLFLKFIPLAVKPDLRVM